MDALLPSRDTSSELAVHMTAEFLQQLDGMNVSHGTRARRSHEQAGPRRSSCAQAGKDRQVHIRLPSKLGGQGADIRDNLKKAPIDDNIDFKKLADQTKGYTGADIANICRQVKLDALEENVSHFERQKKDGKLLEEIQKMKPSAPRARRRLHEFHIVVWWEIMLPILPINNSAARCSRCCRSSCSTRSIRYAISMIASLVVSSRSRPTRSTTRTLTEHPRCRSAVVYISTLNRQLRAPGHPAVPHAPAGDDVGCLSRRVDCTESTS